MNFDTPILFLIFNRPDNTKKVFKRIREIKPKYLYVAADGPRENHPGEAELCKQTRDIVLDGIDWDCEINTLFRDQNLGCGKSVSQAITWFFENVEQGIILEDDILADQTFFTFCEQLLIKYKNSKEVMHITGFNIIGGKEEKIDSYFFALFGTIWGWATWRRAWKLYDFDIKDWKDRSQREFVLSKFPEKFRADRELLYDKIYNNEIDTWDLQWTFNRISNNGLCIVPSMNLIENIGFGKNSTHTGQKPSWSKHPVLQAPLPLIHPSEIRINRKYDKIHLSFSHPHKKCFNVKNILMKYVRKSYKKIFNKLISIVLPSPDPVTYHKENESKYNKRPLLLNIKIIGGENPKINIGKGTYINGLNLYCWDSIIRINIGRYCAVADNVTIIAGGEHDKDWVSSYQFVDLWDIEELKKLKKPRFKGDIEIGNDVWIGQNVTILSGVSIGDGAVIAAGTVVVKDVQPYSISGGVPNKHIKFRFNENDIEKLLILKWWNWEDDKLKNALPYFHNTSLFLENFGEK